MIPGPRSPRIRMRGFRIPPILMGGLHRRGCGGHFPRIVTHPLNSPYSGHGASSAIPTTEYTNHAHRPRLRRIARRVAPDAPTTTALATAAIRGPTPPMPMGESPLLKPTHENAWVPIPPEGVRGILPPHSASSPELPTLRTHRTLRDPHQRVPARLAPTLPHTLPPSCREQQHPQDNQKRAARCTNPQNVPQSHQHDRAPTTHRNRQRIHGHDFHGNRDRLVGGHNHTHRNNDSNLHRPPLNLIPMAILDENPPKAVAQSKGRRHKARWRIRSHILRAQKVLGFIPRRPRVASACADVVHVGAVSPNPEWPPRSHVHAEVE